MYLDRFSAHSRDDLYSLAFFSKVIAVVCEHPISAAIQELLTPSSLTLSNFWDWPTCYFLKEEFLPFFGAYLIIKNTTGVRPSFSVADVHFLVTQLYNLKQFRASDFYVVRVQLKGVIFLLAFSGYHDIAKP